MSPISIPGKVTLKQSNTGVPDLDAQQYIAAVEAADGQALEDGVSLAIHRFVAGCKSDGIWDAIKASCILAGARTLAGALVPLVGTAPTNFNFVSGDYDRETGLKGDASTKYLDSNRNNNADPQDSSHDAIYVTSRNLVATYVFIGAANPFNETGGNRMGLTSPGLSFASVRNSTAFISSRYGADNSFYGMSRSNASNFIFRFNGSNDIASSASEVPSNRNIVVFGEAPNANLSSARISFYSIGESLDLDLLDNRVSTLMTDIGAAIP